MVAGKLLGGFFTLNSYFQNFWQYELVFNGYLDPLRTNQPLGWLILSVSAFLFKQNSLMVLIILTCLANFYFTYRYFRKYERGLIFTVIFCLTPFFTARFGEHIELMQIWVFPLLLSLLEEETKPQKLKVIKTSLLSAITFLISNYLGVIMVVFTNVYYLFGLLAEIINKNKERTAIKNILKAFIFTNILTSTLIFIGISGYLYKTVILKNEEIQGITGVRTIEEYFYFSWRPWYSLIPSTKNIIFHDLSKNIYENIQKSGYFLADDYFVNEHSSSYLGYSLYIPIIFLLIKTIKSKNRTNTILFLTAGFMMLLTLPPYFTVFSTKIYTPGYLYYLVLPYFRVSTRMFVVVHLLLLALLAKNQKSFHINRFLVIIWLLINLVEIYVPIEVRNVEYSIIYNNLNEVSQPGSVFAVYPYNKSKEALFNIGEHQRLLYNPEISMENVNSETYTNTLPERTDYPELDYLLVYKSNLNDFENKLYKYSVSYQNDEAVIYKIK